MNVWGCDHTWGEDKKCIKCGIDVEVWAQKVAMCVILTPPELMEIWLPKNQEKTLSIDKGGF